MKSLLIILLFLCGIKSAAIGQVWVEIISRDDQFAFLGSGSDNRVRVHNMPDGATVEMTNGTAVHTTGDEYVLCKIDPNNSTTELRVLDKGKRIFAKEFRILPTSYSGSIYNPVPKYWNLEASLGGITNRFNGTVEDMKVAVDKGLSLNDTNCVVVSGTVSIVCKGMDWLGPFPICCYSADCDSILSNTYWGRQVYPRLEYSDQLQCPLSDEMKRLLIHYFDCSIFIENIKARCKGEAKAVNAFPITFRYSDKR